MRPRSPSARAQQLRVHSVQALLHRLVAGRHHFESLQLAVPPAMHKCRYGGPSGRSAHIDAVLRMEEHALVVAVEARVPVAMVLIPKVDCAGESVSPSLCWPLPSVPTPVLASRRLLRRRSSCGISWRDSGCVLTVVERLHLDRVEQPQCLRGGLLAGRRRGQSSGDPPCATRAHRPGPARRRPRNSRSPDA